jgi:hypothetical protein
MLAACVALLGGWRATAFAAFAAIALVYGEAQTIRLHRAQAAVEKQAQAQAAAEAQAVAAQLTAESRARAIEQTRAEAAAEAASAYEKGKTDARTTADRVTADLRAGTVRLRSALAGCQTDRVPETPAAAGRADATADDGATIAGAAVGAGAACDAQVMGLQALVLADRQP